MTGDGVQGGVDIDFWRALTAPFDRVELIVSRNGTGVGAVLRYTRIATRESGHTSYVATDLYNYDTSPISPEVWGLPKECPQ